MTQNARAPPGREPPSGGKLGAIIGCIPGRGNVVIGGTIGCIRGWAMRKLGGNGFCKVAKAGGGCKMSGALSSSAAGSWRALRLGLIARVVFAGLQRGMQQRQRSAARINEETTMTAFWCQQSRYGPIVFSRPPRLQVELLVTVLSATVGGGVVGKNGGGVVVVVVGGGGAVAVRGCGQ